MMIDLNHSRNLAVRLRAGRSLGMFILPVLVAGLNLIPAGWAVAQTFTNLHSFAGGSDGAYPYAGLILSGNTLYGTARLGGASGNGTVFRLYTDGTGFTNLYEFTGGDDGAYPYAGLFLSSNTLFGTTLRSGSGDSGTVFAVNTDGTGFTTVYSFTAKSGAPDYSNSDGANPQGGLVLSDNTLYGTATQGGASGNGTAFKVNTDGTGFTNLHSFTAVDPTGANTDGANPFAGLILFSNTLYGTAAGGGNGGAGTVFAVNTDGTGFTNLHTFTAVPYGTNSDGVAPVADLILSGHTLYGSARDGGSGNGTVFKVNIDGTGFATLHSFTASAVDSFGRDTNIDGGLPFGGLFLSGTLYGTTESRGSHGYGTVFTVNTDGTGFATLHAFTAGIGSNGTNGDGASPSCGLILTNNALYGTAQSGGSSGNGTVFRISLSFSPPKLTIIRSASNVILTWPTNVVGFVLQSTTNLVSAAIWTTNLPPPVVINGQNTVTNTISGTQQFFRLSQ